MHLLVATDGSTQSLAAARYVRGLADPAAVSAVTVVAVVRPFAAVAFADELAPDEGPTDPKDRTFRDSARAALGVVAAELADWGPEVTTQLRSGSPAKEILRAAAETGADLVVLASGGRGVSRSVLLGSTAQRVQSYATCPVLVVRPPRRRRAAAGER